MVTKAACGLRPRKENQPMTTQREFVEAYCLAAVSGASAQRSQLKPHDLVHDAQDLWAAIEEETVAQTETIQKKRSKAMDPQHPHHPHQKPDQVLP